jgi:hypothetical protein
VGDGDQIVKLEGGTADAWVVDADPRPAAHRMHFEFDGKRWSELYIYAEGRRAMTDKHGEVPLMVYFETCPQD